MRNVVLSLVVLASLLAGCAQQPEEEVTPVLLEPGAMLPISAEMVLFEERFDDPELGWVVSEAGVREEASQVGGELVLRRTSNVYGEYAYARPHLTFDNFIMEVSGRWGGGAVGGNYGVIFRYRGEGTYYAFYVGNDGRYVLGRRQGGRWEGLFAGFSETIARRGEVNRIHVEVVGQEIRCFVNGTYVGGIRDVEGPGVGDVGVAVWLPEGTDSITAVFDDVVVAQHP
jgi:hypothetical protein